MKKILLAVSIQLSAISLFAQTLNVQVGNVRYLFPAAQTAQMPYENGSTLTVMGKVFNLSEIDSMYVDETAVTDNTVQVAYSAESADITVAGNIARLLTITQTGAHVSIIQSADVAEEITYTLSGTSSDGGFYNEGAFKATVELNDLNLTNISAVYSGAAVHIQNSKRIKVKPLNGTTNTLVDAANGKQKGCLYIKGHAEFAQKGTLNVTGNVKHGIKTGEYFSIKNSTINILSAVGDGINCEQFFLMESGTITINNVADDGLQCDIEDTTVGSTGETVDHEDEDSGNIYISGGTLTMNITGVACKGIKSEGNIAISGGDITISTSGIGMWDTEDLETKAAACISSDANITISGGTLNLTSTGSGGKGLKCDSLLTFTGGTMTIKTTGALYYNNGTTENTNYTGNTDNIDSKYYSSPKGIKAGIKTESGSGWYVTYTYAGGIVISGGKISVSTSGRNAEGIESKSTFVINDGEVVVNAYDDGINAASDLTINGGLVYSRSTNNDGIDANGNVYLKGGLVYAIGGSSPEVAIDANSEEQKKLYVQGGTLVAIGGLESGASLTQSCYKASSWSKNTWYALTVGSDVFAFKTPSSGGSNLIVSGASTPTLKSGVTVSGTEIFDGVGYYPATATGGSSVSLSSYTGGGGPGGGGGRW
ncbi:MAG: carbohydrate-binding domain-containing protein [Paludibacteraceae bacterium]|nr:carbohydrate-binding domain-containing protein [Paludibacteraceae bacterium]